MDSKLCTTLLPRFHFAFFKYILLEVQCLKITAETAKLASCSNSQSLADPWVAYNCERGNKSPFLTDCFRLQKFAHAEEVPVRCQSLTLLLANFNLSCVLCCFSEPAHLHERENLAPWSLAFFFFNPFLVDLFLSY